MCIRDSFEAVDRTRSGAIAASDLRMALRRAGLAIDSDGAARVLEECYDGQTLSLPEFARLVDDIETMLAANGGTHAPWHKPDDALADSQNGGTDGANAAGPAPTPAPPTAALDAAPDAARQHSPPRASSSLTSADGLPQHLEAELAKLAPHA